MAVLWLLPPSRAARAVLSFRPIAPLDRSYALGSSDPAAGSAALAEWSELWFVEKVVTVCSPLVRCIPRSLRVPTSLPVG
jgi:hypothetical protein